MLSTGRHLVLGDIDGPHRLWIRDPLKGSALAYVIVRDEAIDLRQAAVQRLDRRLAGAPPMRLPPGFAPTPFQDRKSVRYGTRGSVRVDLGWRLITKKKN